MTITIRPDVAAEIVEVAELTAKMPGLGRERSGSPDPRFGFYYVNRFVIAFFQDTNTNPLRIVRNVGARRDFKRIF